MKLVSWNVNGIRAVHKKGLFTKFVDELGHPDIICLQETKAEEHQSEVDLPDYTPNTGILLRKKAIAGRRFLPKKSP
jgi:exodeoxyribonuclease-3